MGIRQNYYCPGRDLSKGEEGECNNASPCKRGRVLAESVQSTVVSVASCVPKMNLAEYKICHGHGPKHSIVCTNRISLTFLRGACTEACMKE